MAACATMLSRSAPNKGATRPGTLEVRGISEVTVQDVRQWLAVAKGEDPSGKKKGKPPEEGGQDITVFDCAHSPALEELPGAFGQFTALVALVAHHCFLQELPKSLYAQCKRLEFVDIGACAPTNRPRPLRLSHS